MSIKNKIKTGTNPTAEGVATFTGSGSFDVRDMKC